MGGRFGQAGRIACAAAAVVLLLTPFALHAAGAERYAGWGADGKARVKFSSGLARWDGEHRWLFIGFTDGAPGAGDISSFLKTGWWPDAMKARGVNMYLEFGDGETNASLRALRSFTVSFFRYPAYTGGPFGPTMHFSTQPSTLAPDVSDTFRQWGWQDLSGALGTGGRVLGHAAFTHVYEDKRNHVGPIPYQWDLAFDVVAR